ncbi:SH3 domain-containing protein [Candidatus Gottesmanbacteria bacterium]|nr:SH3 domain-containing protein [Candidatus Gottesmanbacteria bacterium]
MPAKNLYRTEEEGVYSHVYNKGVEKKIIFGDAQDYEVFLGFLKDYLSPPADPKSIKKTFTVNGNVFRGIPHQPKNYFNKVELIAYSLLPDRFHLLLHQKTRGSIETFIRSLCTRYAMYFNKKYQRTGTLFEGPYKSVHIGDEPRLLLLTRYLHRTADHSSYAEYVGTRATSWVKPKKGTGNYRDFMEKYELSQEEQESLKKITFESEPEHLEGRGPERNLKNYPPDMPIVSSEEIHRDPYLNPTKRVPEILATAVVFSLLLTLGLRNVTASKTKTPNPTSAPSVLSKTEESKEIKSKVIVTVKMNNGAAMVNIHEKPTINSKKVAEAKDGDTLEYVSFNSEWYGVKLYDGRTGFIPAAYIK